MSKVTSNDTMKATNISTSFKRAAVVSGKTLARKSPCLIVYHQSWEKFLASLQAEWRRNRPYRHAQATGMCLYQLALHRQFAATDGLRALMKFMDKSGPYGLDGLFLSMMSAASVLNPAIFKEAVKLADSLGKRRLEPAKDGFGIYFLNFNNEKLNTIDKLKDISGSLKGADLPGGRTSPQSGSVWQGSWTDGAASLLAGYPDQFRDGLLQGGLRNAGQDLGNFGRTINKDGVAAMARTKMAQQQALYGITEGCTVAFRIAGAIFGGVVGGAVGGYFDKGAAGGRAGSEAGGWAGEKVGEMVCGALFERGEDKEPGGGSKPDAGSSDAGSSDGGSSGEDKDANEAGICAGDEDICPLPPEAGGKESSTFVNPVAGAILKALGIDVSVKEPTTEEIIANEREKQRRKVAMPGKETGDKKLTVEKPVKAGNYSGNNSTPQRDMGAGMIVGTAGKNIPGDPRSGDPRPGDPPDSDV